MYKKTKKIKLKDLYIGGGSPITVQSMTTTTPDDTVKTLEQISDLEKAGCDIVRITVPSVKSAKKLTKILSNINIPLIADIHFDYRIALASIEAGIDGLRLNPGNIGSEDRIKAVIKAAKEREIPIRVGVNGGSLEKEIVDRYGDSLSEAMVQSALRHVKIIERNGYDQIKISLKSSSIKDTVKAYRKIAKIVDYPLHLGITEAGTKYEGTIKSSIGLGILLFDGIGDTIRVSLTDNPVEEVKVGISILKHLGLREGVEFISCPTCGRAESDLISIAKRVERELSFIKKGIKIAVMGCIVNGPGEAKGADWTLVSGKKSGFIFKDGVQILKIDRNIMVERFIDMVKESVK